MVAVKTLFDRVRDLSRKDKAGYMSSDEFNRDLSTAQTLLMNWYYEQFEKAQIGLDALSPFIKEVFVPIVSQFSNFPTDYRFKLEVGYAYSKNTYLEGCKIGSPEVDVKDMHHLKANEVLKTTSSAIRKPTIDVNTGKGKLAYTFVNDKIKVYPKELVGYLYLKYITNPIEGVYATVINTVNKEEDYNAVNSIDLIWNAQQEPELVELLLFLKGIEVRESALIQWVQQYHSYKNRQ